MPPFSRAPVADLRRPPRWPLVGRPRPMRIGLTAAMRRLARLMSGPAIAASVAFTAMPVHALDVNTASAEQLESLHGVGPNTAKLIVQERERAGPFESLEDLSDRVRGVGHKRLARLRAAGLSAGGGVTVFGPNTIARPQFAPALPDVAPGVN